MFEMVIHKKTPILGSASKLYVCNHGTSLNIAPTLEKERYDHEMMKQKEERNRIYRNIVSQGKDLYCRQILIS